MALQIKGSSLTVDPSPDRSNYSFALPTTLPSDNDETEALRCNKFERDANGHRQQSCCTGNPCTRGDDVPVVAC